MCHIRSLTICDGKERVVSEVLGTNVRDRWETGYIHTYDLGGTEVRHRIDWVGDT